jgi:hypothetical protein
MILQELYRLIPNRFSGVREISAGAAVIAVVPLEFKPLPAGDEPILSVEAKLSPDRRRIPLDVRSGTMSPRRDLSAVDILFGTSLRPVRLEITVGMGTDRRAVCRRISTR